MIYLSSISTPMGHLFQPLLAAVQVLQTISSFLDFLQVLTLLFGVPKIAAGAWSISRGQTQDGMTSVIAGFLVCMAVPITRLFASWLGVTI